MNYRIGNNRYNFPVNPILGDVETEQPQGLLGSFDPSAMGLLGAGAAMLDASGPSRVPVSFGQALGRGLMGGMQGYQSGQDMQSDALMKQIHLKRLAQKEQPQPQLVKYLKDGKQVQEYVVPQAGMKFEGGPNEGQLPQWMDTDPATGQKRISPLWQQMKQIEMQTSPVNLKTGFSGLSPEENDALFGPNGAVTKGEIDPYKINSRTAKIYAQGILANGGNTNMAQISGDLRSINKSVDQQEKVYGSMGSFVKNIEQQVDRFSEISKDLQSFDARLMNVPLREIRGRVAGSPLQSKIDMYLEEISAETGKLATGSTGSVAELSVSAREKWAKIHDPNLSMKDLIDLLNETKHSGQMRLKSVEQQLADTRGRRNNVPSLNTQKSSAPSGGGWSATIVE